MNDDFLSLDNISLRLGGQTVLDHLSFSVKEGEFLSVLGPSGCGKTTLLRVIAGLQAPEKGTVCKRGTDITHQKPSERGIGIVFQNYALFENMSALKNVSYALRFQKQFRGKEEKIASQMLEKMGMKEHLHKLPSQLSGGQQQRVAIARTLVLSPDLLLFDEPMAALDAETRLLLQEELKHLQKELPATILYVTHDQEEAFGLSDRILVMEHGRAHQLATPQTLLEAPADDYVRHFVGDNLRRRAGAMLHYLAASQEPSLSQSSDRCTRNGELS